MRKRMLLVACGPVSCRKRWSEARMMQNGVNGKVWSVPAFLVPAFVLGAAHMWRAGDAGGATACLVWLLACFGRRAWMRPVCFAALVLMAGEWALTAETLVRVRLAMGAPWLRLAAILAGVSMFTAAAAFLVLLGPGRTWFAGNRPRALMQAAAFLLAAVPLFLMARFAPHLLLLERILPGFGMMQGLPAGFWAAWVCGRLADRKSAMRTRLGVWRLFSLVFFGQFALALAGWSLFAMSGQMHIPVPGVIVAGMLYRGTAGFMPFLFAVSVLLAGAAWCSHLCYFGSWDAWAASASRPLRHPGPLRWRVISLGVVCAGTLLLVFWNVPTALAVLCGCALGLVMIPAALLISRKKGYAAYCTTICPLGLLACLLGRLSFWRIRRTSRCTRCGVCIRVCRYGALDAKRLEVGSPGLSCTLCRDCMNVCPHGGWTMGWLGMGTGGGAEQAFVALLSGMHALFLFSAMV